MAQLGLTCKQALQIFSQHETLRLQREVFALKPIANACTWTKGGFTS